jgi:hypothetical protein
MKTIQEKVEWISFLHKQNLNGRETEDELFEAGILAGIEETEVDRDEFAIGFAEWCINYTYHKSFNVWIKNNNYKTEAFTNKELLEIYKKAKGL